MQLPSVGKFMSVSSCCRHVCTVSAFTKIADVNPIVAFPVKLAALVFPFIVTRPFIENGPGNCTMLAAVRSPAYPLQVLLNTGLPEKPGDILQ